MNTIKKYAWPTIIILAASLIVALAILPLANTEFADGIRADAITGGEGGDIRGEGDSGEIPGAVRYVAGFIKEFLLMGVAGVITYTILRIVRRFSRKRKKMEMAPG